MAIQFNKDKFSKKFTKITIIIIIIVSRIVLRDYESVSLDSGTLMYEKIIIIYGI